MIRLHRAKVQGSQPIQRVDQKLGSGLTANDSFNGLPRVFKPAQVVVIDQFETTVVPDTSLESLAAQCGLRIAAVLGH